MRVFTESVVEEAALAWLAALGYSILQGPDIAPGELAAERTDYGQVVLEDRLCQLLMPTPTRAFSREALSLS